MKIYLYEIISSMFVHGFACNIGHRDGRGVIYRVFFPCYTICLLVNTDITAVTVAFIILIKCNFLVRMRYILHVLCKHVHVYSGGLNNNIQLKTHGICYNN